ncbi:translation initiation factor eIF4A [Podila epicladia]|nr:translation initiation factor eIF4A [Podila epicladia]KAG0097790.1 translation initiation factor eIF4A [Podila epicladia]
MEALHSIFKSFSQLLDSFNFRSQSDEGSKETTPQSVPEPDLSLAIEDERTLAGIKQFFIDVEKEEWRFDTLCDLYETVTITQALIFCNTCERVSSLTKMLQSRGLTVSMMHVDMDQTQRQAAMKEYRTGLSRFLTTTDSLRRSIEVAQIPLIINYDMPTSKEDYLLRVGGRGRFGRKGVVLNFITAEDTRTVRDIEQCYATQILEMPMDIADII